MKREKEWVGCVDDRLFQAKFPVCVYIRKEYTPSEARALAKRILERADDAERLRRNYLRRSPKNRARFPRRDGVGGWRR